MRGLRKGVSGKPYPRLCNTRRLRLEPGTFRSQAVRLYRLHQAQIACLCACVITRLLLRAPPPIHLLPWAYPSVDCRPYFVDSRVTHLPGVCKSQNHYQGEQVGYTIKPFKCSSNKLGPLGFQLANRCRAPLLNGTFRAGYTHKDRGRTIPDLSSPSCAIKVTTNKLENVLVLS